MFRVTVQAPSNIALIKYMGKKNPIGNIPANPSISMTLKSLCTYAELTVVPGDSGMRWEPELPRVLTSNSLATLPQLKDRDLSRVFRHVERVLASVPQLFQTVGLEYRCLKSMSGTFRTANTFPASSGIASSASSFAAVTAAAAAACAKDLPAFQKAWEDGPRLRRLLAQLARQGSGSSCRSFEGPWVYWDDEDAVKMDVKGMSALAHFVVLIKTSPKTVSSSEAHVRIESSPLWQGRVPRVRERAQRLSVALLNGDRVNVARLAWTEAWEMHSLFHTAAEPFSYWEPGTIEGLQWLSPYVLGANPPIVTLDAGPNIHIIVERSQRELWRERLQEHFSDYAILEDEPGDGPVFHEWGV